MASTTPSVTGGDRPAKAEAMSHSKKRSTCTSTGSAVAEFILFPITKEPLVDPEDGRTDERSGIKTHIRLLGGTESPLTNESMGPRPLPSIPVRNTMRSVLASIEISRKRNPEDWNERIEAEAYVGEVKEKSKGGDAKRNRDVEDAANDAKRSKTTVEAIFKEFVCPITTEILFDPVAAEDGRIYERSAIETHIRLRGRNTKSPVTNEPMGPKVFPAIQIRNAIRMAVASGVLSGKLVPEDWNERIEYEAYVGKIKRKAESGDVRAMWEFGACHHHGNFGISKDAELAYQWFKKAAVLRDPRGMASMGLMLLNGWGVLQNTTRGVALIVKGASMGYDMAAFFLGKMHYLGSHGMEKDPSQAKCWLLKAVNGSCSIKTLNKKNHSKALGYLRDLE